MAQPDSQVTRFKAGYVCSDEGALELGDVWVRDGKIIEPLKLFYETKESAHTTIDCRGLIVAPGFIDIQINGIIIDNLWYNVLSCLSSLDKAVV